MWKLMLVSCVTVLALVACNSGRVILSPDSGRGSGSGYPYPESHHSIELHKLPELTDPAYDRYQSWERFDGSAFVPDGTHAALNIWFIPRVAGKPVIRRFSVHDGYSAADEKSEYGQCSFRLEYEVQGESTCGDQKNCVQLVLKVTHVMPSSPAPDEPCGQLPLQTLEVVEDFNSQSLAYGPDLVPGFLPETSSKIAWRRSVAPQWSSASTTGAPPPLRQANAYTVGDKVLVFGIAVSGGFKGGWYKPGTNKWEPLATDGAPVLERYGVWTWVKDRLLVVTSGKAYWFKDNAWSAAPVTGIPNYGDEGSPGCIRMAATKNDVMIWGSKIIDDTPFSSGALLDLDGAAWRSVTPNGAPNQRCYPAVNALETGEYVVVGTDGTHSVYYPQGTGLWADAPVFSNDSVTLLDTFMWGNQQAAIIRSEAGGWETHVLDQVAMGWQERREVDRYGMGVTNVRNHPLLFGGQQEKWSAETGADEKLLAADGMMVLSDDAAIHPLVFTPTDLLGARGKPLVAYVQPNKLFVWGGCVRYVGEQCATYDASGAVLNVNLGR